MRLVGCRMPVERKIEKICGLHDSAIQYIADHVKGKITHKGVEKGTVVWRLQQIEPDIVQLRNFNAEAYHEVEIVRMTKRKINTYRNVKARKVLWLVLPKGASSVFSIHILEQDGVQFREVRSSKAGKIFDVSMEDM